MNIAYFIDFPYGSGGSTNQLLRQAYMMSRRGFQVLVVIPNDELGKHAELYDCLLEEWNLQSVCSYYKVATSMEEIDIQSAYNCCDKLQELMKKNHIELAHSAQINIAVELASRKLQIPHIMTVYQAYPQEFNIKWSDLYPRYHTADSALFSDMWAEGLHIDSKCIRECYQPKRNLKLNKREKSRVRILCIGAFAERKRQLEVLEFLLLCKKNGYDCKISFLGNDESPYGEKCKRYALENNLEDSADFVGHTSDVAQFFSGADLLIMASTVESYPGVIVESMAHHVPVLATSVAGVPEIMKDEINGFLIPGDDADAIYMAYKKYIDFTLDGRISQIINNAYMTYEHYHSYDKVGSELEDYYHYVVEKYTKQQLDYYSEKMFKSTFDAFVGKLKLNKFKALTENSLWFIYHMKEKVTGKKIAVWGAGYFGKIALEWLDILDCFPDFIGYIDSKKNGEYLGYPVRNEIEKVLEETEVVLVSVIDVEARLSIMKLLEGKGFEQNKSYFMMFNGPIRI